MGTDKLYTGQQQERDDPALGLYNYGARFYSTTLGRFVSSDPLPFDGLDRFRYGLNNPVRYRDPTGHCVQRSDGSWMRCGRDTMIQFFLCAWGGTCNTGMFDAGTVRQYALGVVNTETFRFFVAIESIARGDIRLRFETSGGIKEALRFIPTNAGIADGITTGRYRLWFDVNASQRAITGGGIEFHPGEGIKVVTIKEGCGLFLCVPRLGVTTILDGWKGETRRTLSANFVDLFLAAGPEGSFAANPFSLARDLNGVGVEVSWHAEFVNGNLVVDEVEKTKVGGADIPFLDLLEFFDEESRSYGW